MIKNEFTTFSRYGQTAGGARVRVFDWLRHLGVVNDVDSVIFTDYEPLHRSFADLRRLGHHLMKHHSLSKISGLDRVLLHRDASPFGWGALEERLLRAAKFGIFDFDDALHLQSAAGRLGNLFRPPIKTTRIVEAADRVVAGNDFLAEWASAHCPDVVVVPSCVQPSAYVRKVDFEVSGVPTVGWIGSASTERYLHLIVRPLLELNRSMGAELVVIGAESASGAFPAQLTGMTRRIPWSLTAQHEQLSSVDVGIMPLEQTDFERGKCAYKLLQYGAAAVPAIGTAIGVSADVCRRFGAPTPVSERDWRDALHGVLTMSSAERARLGNAGHEAVSAHYSFDAWERTFLREVLGISQAEGIRG